MTDSSASMSLVGLKETIASSIINKVQENQEIQGKPPENCHDYLREIKHLYYKFDPEVLKQKDGEIAADVVTSVQVMEKLCKYVYANDNIDRQRTQAILFHIHHHALHNNWLQARNLLMMSHLKQTIEHFDPSTRRLYSRTMAHLGLCAFRHGNIKDAHNCLVVLMANNNVKELLGPGYLLPKRWHKCSKEQDEIETQPQIQFQLHVDLELLECVYLVCAMLINMPFFSAPKSYRGKKKKRISETIYYQLRASERRSLFGPPESMRDHVVAAAKAMRNGNWVLCNNFIINEKMNAKVWDWFYQADKVRAMLTELIKEEALRNHLVIYSHVYDSMSMLILAGMFELKRPIVRSTISKMIINEELMASLDGPTDTVFMHRNKPNLLQSLALQLTAKLNILYKANKNVISKQVAFEKKQEQRPPSPKLQQAKKDGSRQKRERKRKS